jgi:hypothetical protein
MRSINVYMTAILLTSGLLNVPSASLVLADEPLIQSTPSTGAGSEAGTAPGAPEPASPATAPTMQEEPAPTAEATDIQERGVLPGTVAPSVNLLPIPAPTPSLTAIRNTIRVTSKSVSVNLRIPANLPVTVPVEVSVAYNSTAQAQRLTKTYSPTTGLNLLYREAEGDGKPHAMRLDITVREVVPNGKSFSLSKQFTVIPLYNVTISSLDFNVVFGDCDTIGKGDIVLFWGSPDHRTTKIKFDIGALETRNIKEFRWAGKEISTQANLGEPRVSFYEDDFGTYTRILGDLSRSNVPLLLPGQPERYSFVLKAGDIGPPGSPSGSTGCRGHFVYHIARKLLTFDQF